MMLGVVFRWLYPAPLFILNLLLSAGVMFIAFRFGNNKGMFTEIRNAFVRISGIIIKDKALLCIFCMFVLLFCWLVLTGYLFPSYSWDALYYHLPMVGQIMQSGAIQEHSNPSFIQQYMNIFSKNINLFFLWNIIFLKSDRIVDLSQLFFVIAGVLSIYSMAIKMKIREQYALYCCLLFFFTPVLVLQATTNYVDAAVSMLFLIAVNFLIFDEQGNNTGKSRESFLFDEGRISVLLSGLAGGILLGSKPTGPFYIVVLFLAVFIREMMQQRGQFSSASPGKGNLMIKGLQTYFFCFVLPVVLGGGYWYLRNWIVYGNPVYYVDVSIFNVSIFKGLEKNWVEAAPQAIENLNYATRLVHVWLERVGYYMYDSKFSGFGPLWFILFLPSILFSVIYGVAKKKNNLLFVIFVFLVAFALYPRNWITRYVIFIVGMGALSFGIVLEYFHEREKGLKCIALLLAGYAFMTANSPCVMPGKVKEFISLPADERTLANHKPFNIDIKVRREYGYWIWIKNNVLKGDTLAYTFETFKIEALKPVFTAPLWNSEFSNKVVYLKNETYSEWVKALTMAQASYILIRTGSAEDVWVEKERKIYYSLSWMGGLVEKYKILYADEHYKIVQFNKG